MVGCAVYGCTSRSSKKSVQQEYLESIKGQITFHKFPYDRERLRKWINSLHREDFTLSRNSRMCSLHFEDKCFKRTARGALLVKDANPTIFPDYEKNLGQYVYKVGLSKGRFSMPTTLDKKPLKVDLDDPAYSPRPAAKTPSKVKREKITPLRKNAFPNIILKPKKESPKAKRPPNKRKTSTPRRSHPRPLSPVTAQSEPLIIPSPVSPEVKTPIPPVQKTGKRKTGAAAVVLAPSSPKISKIPLPSPTSASTVARLSTPQPIAASTAQKPSSHVVSVTPNQKPSSASHSSVPQIVPQSPSKPVPQTALQESVVGQEDYDELIQALTVGSPEHDVEVQTEVCNEIELETEPDSEPETKVEDYVEMDGEDIVHSDSDVEEVMPVPVDLVDDHPEQSSLQVTYKPYQQKAPRRLDIIRKKRLKKLQLKKRRNVLKIAAFRNNINNLTNLNLIIEDKVSRIIQQMMIG